MSVFKNDQNCLPAPQTPGQGSATRSFRAACGSLATLSGSQEPLQKLRPVPGRNGATRSTSGSPPTTQLYREKSIPTPRGVPPPSTPAAKGGLFPSTPTGGKLERNRRVKEERRKEGEREMREIEKQRKERAEWESQGSRGKGCIPR